MADILATAAAASAVLEQSIRLFDRIRQTVERQKGLPDLIEKYSVEVSQTRDIVESIKSEEALKTPNVHDVIIELGAAGKALRNHLTKLAITKGPVRDFAKQLWSGRRDQEKLESIIRDIGNAKVNLSVYIQLSNVVLTREVGEAVQVSVTAAEAINKLLSEKLGSGHTLKNRRLLEGRPRNADGNVTLTKDDIASPSKQEALAVSKETSLRRETKPQTSRSIRDNESSQYALQVNTPIGIDVWKDIDNVTIEKNKATDHASQWNYPIASVDAFVAAIELRKAQILSKGD